MKNTRIEKLLKAIKEGNATIDNPQILNWCLRYKQSKEKGFDEIVVGKEDCIHESQVKEILDAARELKIEYFVYASNFSGAFTNINEMVKEGARVGKFVVNEYTTNRCGKTKTYEIPGIRINL